AEKWSGGRIEGRAEGNYIISFPGDESEIGSYTDVEVTSAGNYTLEGKAV
ncbi:MAG: TRAM domain-containing protein, partial [Clostridia bacterium]|nr:TRAM domain-containing protein [Clostridia bacterium]